MFMDKMNWKPLFTDEKVKKKILCNIQHISNTLLNTKEPGRSGLLSGTAGESLFWAYYAKLEQSNSYRDKCIELMDLSLNALSSSDLPLNFSVGIAGILWAFNHLIEIDLIEADINEVVSDEIIRFLIKFSELHLNEGQYDYLHEGLGPLIFFLSNTKNNVIEKSLAENVDAFNKSSDKFNTGIAWPMKLMDMKGARPTELSYNLGLSHGNPSIAIILARMLQSNIRTNETRSLLEKNISWILDKEQAMDSLSIFPSTWADKNNSDSFHSRLAWCYGDLGIAIVIYQAGLITNNTEWKDESIKIALHASERRDPAETVIRDTALCHGSIGVAHIFNRLYQYTDIEDFKNAAEYWYLQALDLFDTPQGMKTYRNIKDGFVLELETGLLEGIAGIGLGLIASISDIEPKWDRVLLLS
jgi:lantibiotic modifying enzyme